MQLSYWPLYASNRLELAQPLVDAVAEHLDNLAGNVPEPYRHDSAALPVATDFELVGACVGEPGSEKAQVGNLAWLCHNLWLHYRFGMDDSILRRALYPALRRAVNFYLHFLYEDERGVLHLKRPTPRSTGAPRTATTTSRCCAGAAGRCSRRPTGWARTIRCVRHGGAWRSGWPTIRRTNGV